MPNPCAPGTSVPVPGLGSIVTYDAAMLANWLLGQGMGWLSPFAPRIGGRSYDLASFCAADPPPAPTTNPTDILNFFSPLNPNGAADLNAWLVQVVDYNLWFHNCQCSAAPQPTPPPPIQQPPALNTNPPDTAPPAGQACDTGNFFATTDNTGALTLRYKNNLTQLSSKNATTVVVTKQRTLQTGTSLSARVDYVWFNSTGSPTVLQSETVTQTSVVQPGVVTLQLPPGVFNIGETWTPVSGTYRIGVSDEVAVYCNGESPTGVPQDCCPPDPTIMSILAQLELDVETILAKLGGVNAYKKGVVHQNLTGSGTLNVTGLFGAQIVLLTGVPTAIQFPGVPPYERSVGWLSVLTGDGMIDETRITRQHQVWASALAPYATQIGYQLNPGFSMQLTELLPA